MSDQRWMFSNFQPVRHGSWPVKGIGSDIKPLQAIGVGDILIRARINGSWHNGVFQEVLFVPNLGANLFSVRTAAARGAVSTLTQDEVVISCGIKTVAVGSSRNKNLYVLDVVPIGCGPHHTLPVSFLSRTVTETVNIWHHRLGHVNNAVIKKMDAAGVVDGLQLTRSGDDTICEGCIYGKHHRQPFPTDGRRRGKRVGEIIHSDVVGPMSVPSPNGA